MEEFLCRASDQHLSSSVKSAPKTQPVPKSAGKPSLQLSFFQMLSLLLLKSCTTSIWDSSSVCLYHFPSVFPLFAELKISISGLCQEPAALAGQIRGKQNASCGYMGIMWQFDGYPLGRV